MYWKIWLKSLEGMLKDTRSNSYGFDEVKGADMTEESGSMENAPKKKWIFRPRVQFLSDKGRLRHDSAWFSTKLATFLILSPAKVFTPVFWWLVWLCNRNKLKNRNCFLQIHFVINLLGTLSVNCETDYTHVYIFQIVSNSILELYSS